MEDARRLVAKYVVQYNEVCLRALGYVTPLDKLRGREQDIFAERARKGSSYRDRLLFSHRTEQKW